MGFGRPTSVIYRVVTAGLAAAFVVVFFFPELLRGDAVMALTGNQYKEPPPPSANPSGPIKTIVTSYADAVASASPAVVNIHTAKVVTQRISPLFDDPIFQHFFGDVFGRNNTRKRVKTSLGSGVIISKKGYVLTNNHVIADADKIQVMLQDERSTQAKVVGTDPDTDLAVLKIQLNQLPSIVISQSETLRVGDVVLAIGNPFGVGQTVTMGIVSATGRNRLGINTFEDFIQTDAAINPGNSGGALINPYGQLIGINTAIFSRSGGSQGIGFAIPVSLAKDVMTQIIDHGFVARGWLGIETQNITTDLAESFELDSTNGVLVAGVLRGGPADIAGILPGDVITHVGNAAVDDAHDLINAIARIRPDTTALLEIVRHNKTKTIRAKVKQRPDVKQRSLQSLQ
uniref:Serine protease DegS n=1 Tax=Candidatus Kentrum sp. TUN TaxID=2126343 RepID=A0A450ZZZ7_9GAMM|nr:MAG: serine protease DegS [Candidatus Kentron sp. TUN]VFK59363.1 MAG: serine protease DegS [Candidatus Kentron sp. TUN]VFK62338.1 MAG: serine protease DegS [Candidatus Kentron sp. TUN]